MICDRISFLNTTLFTELWPWELIPYEDFQMQNNGQTWSRAIFGIESENKPGGELKSILLMGFAILPGYCFHLFFSKAGIKSGQVF